MKIKETIVIVEFEVETDSKNKIRQDSFLITEILPNKNYKGISPTGREIEFNESQIVII